jgi:hypothetical protein
MARTAFFVLDTLHIDVDHGVPFIDPQVVQRRDQPHARVADENVEAVETFLGEHHQPGQLLKATHVRHGGDSLAAGLDDPLGEVVQAVRATGGEDDLDTPLGEQQCGRFADSAARAGDGDDLACDARHAVAPSEVLRSIRTTVRCENHGIGHVSACARCRASSP